MKTYLALALLLLELERDAADGATLNPLHQVGGEAGNLVPQALRGDNGDLIDDLLVRVEVHRVETGVVLLDENASGALGGLGTNATLLGVSFILKTGAWASSSRIVLGPLSSFPMLPRAGQGEAQCAPHTARLPNTMQDVPAHRTSSCHSPYCASVVGTGKGSAGRGTLYGAPSCVAPLVVLNTSRDNVHYQGPAEALRKNFGNAPVPPRQFARSARAIFFSLPIP